MKHLKGIGAIVLFVSFYSFAGIDVRVGGGLNISDEMYTGNYKLPDYETQSMLVGFNAGAMVGFSFTPQIGMEAGLSFETRGGGQKIDQSKIDTSYYHGPFSWSYSLYYLQIPVHFSYKPIPNLGISLGPEFGIFLFGKQKQGDQKSDFNDIKTLDFGASVAVDYTFVRMIDVGAAYYFGFVNNDGSPALPDASGGIENTNIKLFVAYVLHF